MRLVIQRALSASVTAVEQGRITGAIDKGLLVLVGIESTDTEHDLEYCANKLVNLKLWPENLDAHSSDDTPRRQWKQSVMEIRGGVLLVSQFTLYARTSKGTKPDFHRAMAGPDARTRFDKFVQSVKTKYVGGNIGVGAFGEYMNVTLVNDGPVTIIIESPKQDNRSS
jgi:D-tyrosyl-tRNA(Tyr) deacylase